MIGTAPRSPTQETRAVSRIGRRNPASTANTATGRATTMSVAATSSDGPATSSSSLGNTSRPSMTNIEICASHAMASWNRMRLFLWRNSVFPMTSPAR